MKIIATTGMPGSGKGVVLDYLKKKNIASIIMREVFEKEMKKEGLELTNKNIREFATKLRKDRGMDIVARLCLPVIKELSKDNEKILIDGIRSYEEVQLFRKELTKDFVLIAIFASPQTRFNRLKQRGEKWDMQKWEEFEWRDNVELGWGLGKSISLADYIIDNDSNGLEELCRKIDEILSKLNH